MLSFSKIHYLSGGAMLIQNNGVDSLLYAYSDFQGSLIALTDVSGNVVEKYAFDPWGARRNPSDWTQKDLRTKWITNRGYTGHEHLDAFGIINMNGRVYDPLTAMFFSPDPYVQAPGNWLNYNRYGYCYGNPFRYTDPSGKYAVIDDIIGAVICGTINLITNWNSSHSFWQGLSYFGIGASGYLVGEYAGGPIIAGAYMSGMNDFTTQAFAKGIGNVNFAQTAFSSIIGGCTAEAGQALGKVVGPGIKDFTSTLTKSPVLQQVLNQGTTNAISGFSIGTGLSLLNGKSFDDALGNGAESGLMGFGIGAVNGVVSGIQDANKHNVNPWTGELKPVYHYTNSALVPAIQATGIRQSADGFTYTTTNPDYTSPQAIDALNLNANGGVRDAVFKIDAARMAADGIYPAFDLRPVWGGTGNEILYRGDIPNNYIFRIK
jgi:RHS repeat-associated protein